MTTHVLILCTHNSARSVLAEAMLNHLAAKLGKDVRAHSAGSSPSGGVNPFAIEVLNDAGVDTRTLRSKSWDEFSRSDGPPLSIVITVCDNAAAEVCPVFFGGSAGQPVKVHWSYHDPGHTVGDDPTVRRAFELTRQAIAYRMLQLLALPLEHMDRRSLQTALNEIGRS
jgi:arsenate reductase